MSALRLDQVRLQDGGEPIDLQVGVGERLLLRGAPLLLDRIFRVLSGRITAASGRVELLGAGHPGAEVRTPRWARRVSFSRGELHLVENIDLLRNLTVPMVYALGIRERRARTLAMEVLEELGVAEHARRRPAEVRTHVRQIVHVARATTPGRELVILLDPQEGLLASDASRRLGSLLADCRTAIILCSEGWLAPPEGFEDRAIETTI